MPKSDDIWMAYIEQEVRDTCGVKHWGYQIRRRWSVREKPVAESPVEDYEWKLIPDAGGNLPGQPTTDFDQGTYYLVSVDRRKGKFTLQHDTAQCGIKGPHWNSRSYTDIHFIGSLGELNFEQILREARGTELEWRLGEPPAKGWLREYLIDLTTRFGPNQFSIT